MKIQFLHVLILALAATALYAAPASAQHCDDGSCAICAGDAGTENWLDIGGVMESVEGSEESNEQRGLLGNTFITSGRLHLPKDYWKKTRFEVRWQDITAETGRTWGRLTLHPFTVESDNFLRKDRKWVIDDPMSLIAQEVTSDDVKVRWHRGGLDNTLLRYQRLEFNYPGIDDTFVELSRLGLKNNFTLGDGRVFGSASQTATSVTAPEIDVQGGEIDTTALRLDARLDDTWALYGRGAVSKLTYDNLADDEMTASNYNLGISFKPTCDWQFKADLGAREYPTDNAVSSHVSGFNEFNFRVDYNSGCDRWLAAGFSHKRVDYNRLNIKDQQVTQLIRQPAILTPAQVAHAVDVLNPEVDETWVEGRWALGNRLTASARLSYIDGDNPETTISEDTLAGLFYHRRLDRTLNLYYDADGSNQFAVLYKVNESLNEDRNNSFDLRYVQGSWSRCVGGGNLALIVSNTESELGETVAPGYTTDEMSYGLNFSRQLTKFDYGLDLAYTDGSGYDEYTQTNLGADFAFKCWGPLSLRIDWFDRSYDAQPAFNTTATEFMLRYKIDL